MSPITLFQGLESEEGGGGGGGRRTTGHLNQRRKNKKDENGENSWRQSRSRVTPGSPALVCADCI